MDNIKDLIYEIRGKQVMLDCDVAALYNYDTKRINETVKRNIKRFPSKFCFKLIPEEYAVTFEEPCSRSQFATAYNNKRNDRYLPYVFTEQGIAMLSGLLKNDTAIEVSINKMNAFVEMRKFISNNAIVFQRLTTIEYKMPKHDKKLMHWKINKR